MMYCNDELKLMVVEEVDKREEDVVWVSKRNTQQCGRHKNKKASIVLVTAAAAGPLILTLLSKHHRVLSPAS